MATTMKTPGVYIKELDAFGNAVVPVPTAIPVFIGYTEKTSFNGEDITQMPIKIGSLADYLTIFGNEAPKTQFSLSSNVLPERVTILQQLQSNTAKDVATAQLAINKVAAATQDQKDALATAKKLDQNAQTALSAAQADPNIKKLSAAKDALAKNENDTKTQELKDAVTTAQKVIDAIVSNADFISKGIAYKLTQETLNYRMYSSMKFFYENGGGECYVISIGNYDYSASSIDDTDPFLKAIKLLEKETEPTMLVIPDIVEMGNDTAYSVQRQMMNHCGKMMNRVAILDIPGGYTEEIGQATSVDKFRDAVEPLDPKFNSYAAAYYPWLHTTIYQTTEISTENLKSSDKKYTQLIQLTNDEFMDAKGIPNTNMRGQITSLITALKSTPSEERNTSVTYYDSVLKNLSTSYGQLISAIKQKMNLLAPSAAMAGIYTSVDNNEGVWKAPANVGVQSTIAPSINIDHETQQDLNVPISGKAVCAIRAFKGEGNLVWGARTLDGNSNDWRYINIRRTLIFIEQSVKDAAKAYVFAPNDANTWVNVTSMISNFLTGLWKQGALVGPKPADAFSVSVGLGVTMTNDDIQQGIMRVSVKVALSHPAEFIEITFQQQQQKA